MASVPFPFILKIQRRLSPGRLIRVFKVFRWLLSFALNYFTELPDNSLSKGFPWACGRTGWETRIAHLLNGGLSIWVRILTNRFTDVLGPG